MRPASMNQMAHTLVWMLADTDERRRRDLNPADRATASAAPQLYFGGDGFVYLCGNTSGVTRTSVVNLNGVAVPFA